LIGLVFLVTAGIIVIYLYSGTISFGPAQKNVAPKTIKKQISINIGIWLLLLAWGYFLERYDILYSSSGVVYGASYTDTHVVLPATWVRSISCLVLAGLAFFQIYINRLKWLITGGLAVLTIGIIETVILPAGIQNFVVEPNELQL